MSDSQKNKLDTFAFHGVELRLKDGAKQAVGDCPFCTKAKHFLVSPDTGQWDCKSCGKSGNVYSFLSQFYQDRLDSTPKSAYKSLEKDRGIPAAMFESAGLALDGERWLIPMYNEEGKLSNLLVKEPGKPVISTTGCALHLLGMERLVKMRQQDRSPIYVCEGPWDWIALQWLLKKAKKPGLVVSAPGAAVFKRSWLPAFKDREVKLVYDNDNAGESGIVKAAELLATENATVFGIRWPSKTPEGYDINDFISSRKAKPSAAFKELQGLLEDMTPVAEPENLSYARTLPGKPPSFQTVVKEFKSVLHMDKNMEDCLAIMFATALSIQMTGDPIWLFLVGPPGSGKTLFLRSMESARFCHFESSLTAHSLISGFRGEEDPSLIPKIKGKCLILKDYTEIKSLPMTVQEEIYGVLRGAYDGDVRRPFGNGIIREYKDCYFSMIAGVTDVIHGDHRATLGERFLKLEFISGEHDTEKHLRAAIMAMDKLHDKEGRLREITQDFLDREIVKSKNGVAKTPTVPQWVVNRIMGIAQLAAYMRAGVPRFRSGDIQYRVRPEVGTRIAKQLIKLGKALAVVLGKTTIDARCYELMERVAFDTSAGWHKDIIKLLITQENPINAKEVAYQAQVPYSTASRKLEDLLELGVVQRERMKTASRGQPPFGYVVTKPIRDLWKSAKIGTRKK